MAILAGDYSLQGGIMDIKENIDKVEAVAELLWKQAGNTGDFQSGIKTAWRCVVDKYFVEAREIILLITQHRQFW